MNAHQRSIDGLRGIAILLVIMFHTDVGYFGWTGVILFFVLSGYLITKVLFAEKEKRLPIRTKFRNFWMRRILRIFPLCYLYLVILVIGLVLKFISTDVGKELPWLFSYTYNFYLISVYDQTEPSFLAGHFWSLSIEEQFYVFYPLMVFFLGKKQLKFTAIGLVVFSILFRFFSYEEVNGISYNVSSSIDFHSFSYIDSFVAGAAIFIFRLDTMKPRIGNVLLAVSSLVLMSAGFITYMQLFGNYKFNIFNYLSNFGVVAHYCNDYYCVWMPICLNFFFSSLLLVLLLPAPNTLHRLFKRIFETSFLAGIGKVSYGMYVFHAIIIWVLKAVDKGPGNKYLFFLICLAGTWLVSFVIYHLYEKKFLALKDKFR